MAITKSMSFLVILLVIGMVIFSIAQVVAPLVGSLSYSASTTTYHATQKHGLDASMARECSSRPELKFYNEHTRRTAFMCTVEGFFGIHILDENGNEVTAFLKNKMKTVDQVINYMKNSGYQLLH